MHKLTRQNELYQLLFNHQSYSNTELSKHYECTTKTISRDFEDIARAIPEVLKQGKQKWHIPNQNKLTKLSFYHIQIQEILKTLPQDMVDDLAMGKENLDDDIVLEMLLQISKSMGKTFFSHTKTLISKVQDINTIFTRVNFEDITTSVDILKALESSILKRVEVTYSYQKFTFTVEPYKIISFDGYWYLLGRDVKKNTIKKYKIKDINNLSLNKNVFMYDENISDKLENAINVWFNPNKEGYTVELLINKEVKHYFKERPINKSQRIRENEDGSMEIELTITHNMEIVPLIGYWTPHIKVISPEHLYNEVIGRIKSLVEDYQL